MKIRGIAVFILVFALLLAGVSAVLAQDENPQNPPPLQDPTDLRDVIGWLAGGGAGAYLAIWLEKKQWFQNIKSEYKPITVLACIGGIALIAQIALNFIPDNVWDVIGPYFTTIMSAILVGYPVSQMVHSQSKQELPPERLE